MKSYSRTKNACGGAPRDVARSHMIGQGEVQAFLQAQQQRGLSPKTQRIRQQSLAAFSLYITTAGISRLQDVTSAHLEAYRADLANRDLSDATSDVYLRSVRQFFGHLESTGRVFLNPAAGLRLPRVQRHLRPVPTPADMSHLLAAPDATRPSGVRDRAILEVAYSTGMRLGELHGLNVTDPDCDQGLIRVTGKGRKERTLPLGKQAMDWLRQYVQRERPRLLKAEGDESALWINRYGQRLGPIRLQQVARDYARAAGIESTMSIHAIRRACATHMLQNGAHPVQLQMLLGHASLRTLSQYLQVTITDLRRAHLKSNPGQ